MEYFIDHTGLMPHQLMLSNRHVIIGGRGCGKTSTMVNHAIIYAAENANDRALLWVPDGHLGYIRDIMMTYPKNLDWHQGPSLPDMKGKGPYDLICVDEPSVHGIDLHQVSRLGKRIFSAFTPTPTYCKGILGVPKDWTITHASSYQNIHLNHRVKKRLQLSSDDQVYGR